MVAAVSICYYLLYLWWKIFTSSVSENETSFLRGALAPGVTPWLPEDDVWSMTSLRNPWLTAIGVTEVSETVRGLRMLGDTFGAFWSAKVHEMIQMIVLIPNEVQSNKKIIEQVNVKNIYYHINTTINLKSEIPSDELEDYTSTSNIVPNV